VGVASQDAAGGDVGLGDEAPSVPDGEGAAFTGAVLSDAPPRIVVVEGGGDGAAGGDLGEAVSGSVGEIGFRRRAAGRRDGLGDLVAVGVEAVGGVRAGDRVVDGGELVEGVIRIDLVGGFGAGAVGDGLGKLGVRSLGFALPLVSP
jgi:hypothetical protein